MYEQRSAPTGCASDFDPFFVFFFQLLNIYCLLTAFWTNHCVTLHSVTREKRYTYWDLISSMAATHSMS